MTPIGYVWDGDIYCDSCLDRDGVDYKNDERVSAIFDETAFDYPLHCGQCREFLGGNLTQFGFEWLKEYWLVRRWRNFDQIKQYMDYHDRFDWYFIPSPWGWMDPLGNLRVV